MNPKDAILKIKALFEEMPQAEEKVEEVKADFAEYTLADGTKVMISSMEIDDRASILRTCWIRVSPS